MPQTRPASRSAAPDPDLLAYVVVSVPFIAGLAPVASAALELVDADHVRLLDVVALLRPGRDAAVAVIDPRHQAPLSELHTRITDDGVRLTAHDVDLAAATLAPGTVVLLLLLEDRWASPLSAAAARAGGRLSAGERIARDRVLGQTEQTWPTGNGGRPDLLARGPLTTSSAGGPALPIDPAAQVRELTQLVDRGLLTLDQYEAQRRRVLDG